MARKTKEQPAAPVGALPAPRLKRHYSDVVLPKLKEQFGYTTVMQAPKLQKIVINMGVGNSEKDPKALENSLRDMTLIAGQKPVATVARKAISNFRLREGMKIGCKVTLRGDRAYHFFDRLSTVVLPRIRDFQGLSPNSFDGRGNYSLGLKEQLVFPEIPYDTFDKIRGMDITICTSARTDEESRVFLKEMGLPLRDK
ncbi:MAG: 50S ribosomal protein L5 [Fimbriimonadaceae bacterium]|nr:50S ribosomal protein L5 [Fimbriimonadaceae bacterium]